MSPQARWPRSPEWLDDPRRAPRWQDVRTVLARFGEDERLGKTVDVSTGGAGLRVPGPPPPPGARVRLYVVFEEGVRELEGQVVHGRQGQAGSRVGVRWQGLSPELSGFLHRRYGEGSGGRGRVT